MAVCFMLVIIWIYNYYWQEWKDSNLHRRFWRPLLCLWTTLLYFGWKRGNRTLICGFGDRDFTIKLFPNIWQEWKDSNPHRRFWRPLLCLWTTLLYFGWKGEIRTLIHGFGDRCSTIELPSNICFLYIMYIILWIL